MKCSEQRIFISDLPEAATDKEIKSLFNKYGKVTSIEIKTRKELTAKNKSHFFGYVNLETDHYNLNECFKDFQNEPWHGDYVKLQIAKESFLDRLKREREENQIKEKKEDAHGIVGLPKDDPIINIPSSKSSMCDRRNKSSIKNISEEEFSSNIGEEIKKSSIEEETRKLGKKSKKLELNGLDNEVTKDQDEPALKIRKITPNNKIVNKIPSFGHEPVGVFNAKQEKPKSLSEANLKRLESLKKLKKGYQNEKDLIKNALKNIDRQPNNKKIIFDDDGPHEKKMSKSIVNGSHKKKNQLFNQEDSDSDEFEGNFEIQEHLGGEKGKKLLEMQSKFHNDKRFALDKRFLEDETQQNIKNDFAEEKESLETEKTKEMDILEQVLGKKITKSTSKKTEKSVPTKAMLRFDPSQKNSNFELENVLEEPKKKKNRKELKEEVERAQNIDKPEVSKEVFYKVSDNLKETFQDSHGFRFLGAFKRTKLDEDNTNQINHKTELDTSVPKTSLSKNPFKYDSSDNEDEIADIPHTNEPLKSGDTQQQTKFSSSRSVFWTETFFFKPDDHRLQDGFDFIEKMKTPDDKEFSIVRQGLKGVIRTKVRNSERKNRMFKKKLGGGGRSNRRKHIRIKKALKR